VKWLAATEADGVRIDRRIDVTHDFAVRAAAVPCGPQAVSPQFRIDSEFFSQTSGRGVNPDDSLGGS
jgi:hypothetical protein